MALFRRLGAALGLVVFFTLIHGFLEARSDPVVRRATIAIDRLPHDTPPLRLALVSDIHVGNLATPVGRLNRIVDLINAQHPDAVLLDGDMVNGDGPDSPEAMPQVLTAPLSRLKAPLGVYFSMGNHDQATRPDLVAQALTRAGVQVLNEQAVRLGSIALFGTTFRHIHRDGYLPVMAQTRRLGGVPVMMTHVPPWPAIVPKDVPLVLSGHTHCGQIVIGPWDNSFDPLHRGHPRFDERFRCGFAHALGYTILVTGGVGASSELPARINVPPDFWMVTLVGHP
jgi:uncharacterized protein